MSVALIYGRRTSIIGLGLRIVNLRYGGRQCYKGARLFKPELWGVPVIGGWSYGRHYTWYSLLCRTWVLIASIADVVIVIDICGIAGFAANLGMLVLVSPLLSPLPRIRIAALYRTW